MENIGFQLYIDSNSILNLNADFFNSIRYNFENSRIVKIELKENSLLKLIKRNTKCGLRINASETRTGVVTDVSKGDHTVLITCELKEGL